MYIRARLVSLRTLHVVTWSPHSIRPLSKGHRLTLQVQAATWLQRGTHAHLGRFSFLSALDCNLCSRHFELPLISQWESILNISSLWASFFWVSTTTIKYLKRSDTTRNYSCLPKTECQRKNKWQAFELAAFFFFFPLEWHLWTQFTWIIPPHSLRLSSGCASSSGKVSLFLASP